MVLFAIVYLGKVLLNNIVNWISSSSSSTFKLWFVVEDATDGLNMYKNCVPFLSDFYYSGYTIANHGYWLQAAREYITDPVTYNSGNWYLNR